MTGRVGTLVMVLLLAQASAQEPSIYRPPLAVSDTVEPFLARLDPANDVFVSERLAKDIGLRLRELSDALRAGPAKIAGVTDRLLAPEFRGARLTPSAAAPSASSQALEVTRATSLPKDLTLDARAFGAELRRLVGDLRTVSVAELLITSVHAEGTGPSELVRTDVRFDIVGTGAKAFRAELVGVWSMGWRRGPAGWRVASWSTTSLVTSRARSAIFTEVTQAALGGTDAFRRQLTIGLDAWMATFDSVLTRDSNGHHGVSVGDADGDGLEDLYIGQPAGLPNRLFRARGDGTFEDITDASGLGILDDTAQSLFVDVDNDGDEDVVLATGTQPLLFVNDGKGHFSQVTDAFRFAQPIQGVLTSISMADYDRDGFLDLYLCVYSYFFGAGEEKAGTPAPYYDARNGPPGVLLHNDGHGRFVDVTEQAGLAAGNDRYHFAAAWGDYDDDGWPDLLVANDFGTKNLYRNRGARGGAATFEDVATAAGVLDYGAGMSATFLDYDNDGRLDIYTGNMWSDAGLRVTGAAEFMPGASPEVRARYQHHARGNSLLRNLGDGRFEDTTIAAHAEMGRWAWSSDALDVDNDGWEDLYVANGMLTRDNGTSPETDGGDLDGFFWRQVVAHSPLTRVKGTPYDDAWRAINQLLIHGSIASHQRNVFLRNDGRGGFDDISGTVGLDLDQDGRSFAVFDIDGDGDEDLAVMAARQAPQLRLFRNDLGTTGAALTLQLVGTKSNRDAVGARVTVDSEGLRRTKIVQAGSGFLSQHSKVVHIGLGARQRVQTLTVRWPSGATQTFPDLPANGRYRLVEGGSLEAQPAGARPAVGKPPVAETSAAAPPESTWMYEPFPAPDFSVTDLRGQTRTLAMLGGHPAVVLLWSSSAAPARAALSALDRGAQTLTQAGIGVVTIALDPPERVAQVRAALPASVPVIHASRDLALSYAILNRHLFMNRQDLRLPTTLLLDARGAVAKVYRDRVDVAAIVRDAATIDVTPDERLARALPFAGRFTTGQPRRNYLPYGRELLDQGLDAAAVVAFERAAQNSPTAPILYRLGTLLAKSGEAPRAQAAFERALAIQPDLAEAHNDLGALRAQGGDLDRAIRHFRAAIAATPDYPDALNNLGYALLLRGNDAEARTLYERALALQPDFPEALNNLGLLVGRAGDLPRAEQYFREALTRRADYGEAANNLALVLVNRGRTDEAISLLESTLTKTPQYESAYITLAKIYFATERSKEGVAILERLLQRNPTQPLGLELLKQWKAR